MSLLELLLILIICIITFRPKELIQLIIYLYKLYQRLKQLLLNIIDDIELEQIKKELEIFDSSQMVINKDVDTLIYYQPELDFEYQPELFDDI